jgi:hypothetical protein
MSCRGWIFWRGRQPCDEESALFVVFSMPQKADPPLAQDDS